jgi:hypothetical protein
MRSKAVLFGINYVNTPSSQLRGCVNDVKNMSAFLKQEMGYDVVKEYTDEYNISKVTGRSIINALYKLAMDSYRHDLERVWIHFSGHGSYLKDRDGDEKDGWDECIVPADYQRCGVIVDDTIKRLMRYFNPKTHVTCIFDCCHSGTMGDLRYTYQKDCMTPLVTNDKSKCRAKVVMLSGCMDHQTSADAYNVRGKYEYSGAMTSCLLMAMKKSGNLRTILANTRELLSARGFTQYPLLSTSYEISDATSIIH